MHSHYYILYLPLHFKKFILKYKCILWNEFFGMQQEVQEINVSKILVGQTLSGRIKMPMWRVLLGAPVLLLVHPAFCVNSKISLP